MEKIGGVENKKSCSEIHFSCFTMIETDTDTPHIQAPFAAFSHNNVPDWLSWLGPLSFYTQFCNWTPSFYRWSQLPVAVQRWGKASRVTAQLVLVHMLGVSHWKTGDGNVKIQEAKNHVDKKVLMLARGDFWLVGKRAKALTGRWRQTVTKWVAGFLLQ